MGRYSFRRKYQTGGVIPSFQGADVLSRGPQIAPIQARPIVYDPNPVFNAQQAKENAMRTAISQADFNRREKQDMWREEIYNRQYLDTKLNLLREQIMLGQDALTKLDLSIPEQYKMAQNMRKGLSDITSQGIGVLTDNSLTPEERSIRLNEQTLKVRELFNDPNYQKYVQTNVLTSKVYDGIADAASKGDMLIDYEAANQNIENARRYQRGEIDTGKFFSGMKNFTINPAVADQFEVKVDGYIRDSLDPDKVASNWEKYKDDEDFLIFNKKFTVPDLESQVETVFNLYMENPHWWKVQKARGLDRSFLDDDGFVDEDKLKNHIRRKIELFRTSLGAQGKEIITDINITKRPSETGSDGNLTDAQKQDLLIRQDLDNMGYDVLYPSVLRSIDDATAVKYLLEIPESEVKLLSKEQQEFRKKLQQSVVKKPPKPEPKPEEPGAIQRKPNGELDINSLGTIYDDLRPGDNTNILPEQLTKNLGFYTNNPFNVKTESKDTTDPHIKTYDKEKTGGYHRVYPTMEDGFKAGAQLLVNRYMTDKGDGLPPNRKFRENLIKAGKTLDEATIGDMYKTWATGATDDHIKKIADEAGVDVDTPLLDVPIQGLLRGMLKIENPEIFKAIQAGTELEAVNNPVGAPSRASLIARQTPTSVPQVQVPQGGSVDWNKYEKK